MTQGNKTTAQKATQRQQRLAAQLRANLTKRKQQARKRAQAGSRDDPTSGLDDEPATPD
jgi:hypothetical protein